MNRPSTRAPIACANLSAATVIPEIHQLLNGGKLYVHTSDKYLHVSSKGDGSLDFYITFKRNEHWIQNSGFDFSDKTQLLEWAGQEFAGWSPLWLDLFTHVVMPLLDRPQYCMPLEHRWETLPDLTLLGDAAHPMPPSGERVNLAMLDALALADCLTSDRYPIRRRRLPHTNRKCSKEAPPKRVNRLKWQTGCCRKAHRNA